MLGASDYCEAVCLVKFSDSGCGFAGCLVYSVCNGLFWFGCVCSVGCIIVCS